MNSYSYTGPGERWAEDDPTAEDYLNVSRENADHLYEALNTVMDTDAADGVLTPSSITLTGNITMADDTWIGLGAGAGRIVFDSTPTPDTITFSDAAVVCSGTLGAGATTVTTLDATSAITLTNDQNNITEITVDNGTAGTGAGARLVLAADAGIAYLMTLSGSYTTSGFYTADTGLLFTDSNLSGGLSFGTNHATADISFWTANGNQRMTIDGATGNVGIGTASPGNLLDIVSGATQNSTVHIGEAIDEGMYLLSTADSQFGISGGAEFVSNAWTARATEAALIRSESGYILFTTDASLTDGSTFTPTERMRLDSSGNVGIGTSSPSSPLTIGAYTAGSANLGAKQAAADAYGIVIEASANDRWLRMGHDGTTGIIETTFLSTGGNSDLVFKTGGSESLRLDSSGNLGLGVTPHGTYSTYTSQSIGGMGYIAANTTAAAGNTLDILNNSNLDTDGNWKYIANDEVSRLLMVDGTFQFYSVGASTGTISSWGTAKLTISNVGLINTTTTAGNNTLITTNSNASTPYGMYIDFSAASPNNTTQYYIRCDDSTDIDFIVYSDGSVQGRANSYGGISDVALKTNITPARDYWDDWKKLKYSKWQWTSEYETEGDEAKKLFGIVAQDLAEVFPGATYDTDEGLAVRTSVVNTIGGRVLQRAQERIEDCEGAIMKTTLDWKAEAQKLSARVADLEAQLGKAA